MTTEAAVEVEVAAQVRLHVVVVVAALPPHRAVVAVAAPARLHAAAAADQAQVPVLQHAGRWEEAPETNLLGHLAVIAWAPAELDLHAQPARWAIVTEAPA